MKKTIEIVSLDLANEMDLILAHKRSMKLAEMCGLSLPVQTSFATAVSEIARAAMGRKRNKSASMKLAIVVTQLNKKQLLAGILLNKEDFDQGAEAVSYARRLVDELAVSEVRGKVEVLLSESILLSTLLNDEKIKSIIAYFDSEPPLSAYDEIRKKNIQLITMSDKLKESEAEYRKLTETLPLMMFTLNVFGKISRTNEWLNSFFNQKTNALNGKLWYTLVHAEDQKKLIPVWEKAQIEKQSLNIQARVKGHKQDAFLWHMINIVPVKGRNGNVSEWAGFFVDIHAQKLIEQTLQNNETLKQTQKDLIAKNDELTMQKEFVELILDSSVDLIGVYDTEMRIIAFNKKCEQVYRLKKEEVIGKHFLEIFPTAKDSQAHRDLDRAIKGQMVSNKVFHTPLVNKYYENYLIPLRSSEGKVYSVLVIAHDISEMVAAESKLKNANEELQKSNHDLEQFAYIASHDLQEPLRKIRNFCELLEKSMESKALREKYLGKIDSSAARMAALINDVLNYSRLSSVNDEFDTVDLNEVLVNVKTDFELLIDEKHATVNSGELPVLRGVKLQLHQLFSNLVSNSLKFSDKKPVIHISASSVRSAEKKQLELDEKKPYVALVFKDNGIGFDQKYADQIFTIFQRLKTGPEYSGTGIGLALCKKIVDKHNGRILAKSEKGAGAEFRIILPA